MALIFMDGFDAADYAKKYQAVSSNMVTSATTRYGAGLSFTAGGVLENFRKDFPAATKLIMGFSFRCSAFSDGIDLLNLYGDTASNRHIHARVLTNGSVAVYRSSGTLIANSAPGVCTPGAWHYFELSATISDTVGVVTARIDGIQVCTFTGDTRAGGTNATLDAVFLQTIGNNGAYFDDLYIADGTGAAPWNDFLGEVRVQTLVPSAAGSQADLTPVGVANNWDNVNELPFSATDYNYSGVAGARDLYAMADVSVLTTSVLGVQLVTTAHKTDTSARSVKQLVKSGGTVYASAARGLAVTPTLGMTVHQVNPATSAAWTPAEVNAMETGVEVV